MEFETGPWPPPSREKSSHFRGVHWCSSKRIWRAEIEVNGVPHKLGRFDDAQKAAQAYDAAAIRLGVPERCNAWWSYTMSITPPRRHKRGKSSMRISRA